MNDQNLLEDQPIAWTPTPEVIERAQLTRFMKQFGVSTWDELYAFSINDVEKFTAEVLRFLDIKFDPPYEKLLDLSNGIEIPNWFVTTSLPQSRGDAEPGSEPGAIATGFPSHAGLNITEMCLDRWQTDEMKDQLAVIWELEDGETSTCSYEMLLKLVKVVAAGLRTQGFGKGDAIGIHLPMMLETIIALLAIGRIGAIAVPVFSGYGVEAIASRLTAVEAKALITCDGFTRRGKFFNALEIAEAAVARCPSLQKIIVNTHNKYKSFSSENPKVLHFWDLIDSGFKNYDFAYKFYGTESSIRFDADYVEPTSAEDPLIILYTSGTTGKP